MAKWYILHTMSGSENIVKKQIEEQILKNDMSSYFEEIFVPVVEVPQIKKGKKVIQEKKFMPGYVLIKMEMNDQSWHLIKGVKKITGFLGSKNKPHPLKQSEVDKIFDKIAVESESAKKSSLYNIGDKVDIIDGPFDNFSGVVENVDVELQKLTIAVSIFGKHTPIELGFTQVKKKT